MRVLVTGAGGFIGSHVAHELVSAGHEVHAVVRPGGTRMRLTDIRDRLSFLELDLADTSAASGALSSLRPDALVHLAWYAEPGTYLHAVAENQAALRSSTSLIAVATQLGCQRIVLGGTCLETAIETPPTAYADAKRSLHDVLQVAIRAGVSGVCGHVYYLYGPWEDSRRVVPSIVRSLLRKEAIPTTDGQMMRDYLHVTDVATGFRHLVESSVVGTADICSGTVVMLRDVLVAAADELGRRSLLELGALGPTTGAGCSRAGDPSTLTELGWKPRYDMRTGIADTVSWWRRQESQT